MLLIIFNPHNIKTVYFQVRLNDIGYLNDAVLFNKSSSFYNKWVSTDFKSGIEDYDNYYKSKIDNSTIWGYDKIGQEMYICYVHFSFDHYLRPAWLCYSVDNVTTLWIKSHVFSKLVFSYHKSLGCNISKKHFFVYDYGKLYQTNNYDFWSNILLEFCKIWEYKISNCHDYCAYVKSCFSSNQLLHISCIITCFSLHKSKWKHNCTNMQMIFFLIVSCMILFPPAKWGNTFSYFLFLLGKNTV